MRACVRVLYLPISHFNGKLKKNSRAFNNLLNGWDQTRVSSYQQPVMSSSLSQRWFRHLPWGAYSELSVIPSVSNLNISHCVIVYHNSRAAPHTFLFYSGQQEGIGNPAKEIAHSLMIHLVEETCTFVKKGNDPEWAKHTGDAGKLPETGPAYTQDTRKAPRCSWRVHLPSQPCLKPS